MPNCFPSVSKQSTWSPSFPCEDGKCSSSSADANEGPWNEIPDSLLLQIFSYLAPREVIQSGAVCKKWNRIALDEILWKNLFLDNFGIDRKTSLPPQAKLWSSEYQRLQHQTPEIQTQVLTEHSDEVLHVAFAHNGRYFVSSSKDCSAILWEDRDGKVVQRQTYTCHGLGWEYVQFCEFSPDDTLLLISGVNKMRRFSFRGEIAIYTVGDNTRWKSFVINEPYDVFGTWLNNNFFISGNFQFAEPDYISTVSELWATSVAEQDVETLLTDSEAEIVANKRVSLCRIINKNSSSVRSIAVAKFQGFKNFSDPDIVMLIFTHGTVTYTPHQVLFKKINFQSRIPLSSSFQSDVSEGAGYTTADHVIETHAHIIGLALSPENDFLYVNCRPWVAEGKYVTPDEPPAISDAIHLRVYDLTSYQLVREHTGHKAFTPNDGCFFIFLSVSEKLVASGAEDKRAHVWDRHYGVKLATLEGHKNVVNAVAFNPADPEMLVSASDDNKLCVWRSRRRIKELYVRK